MPASNSRINDPIAREVALWFADERQRKGVFRIVGLGREERRIDIAKRRDKLRVFGKIVQESVAQPCSDELSVDVDQVHLLARQDGGARDAIPLDVAWQSTKIHRYVGISGHEVGRDLLPRRHFWHIDVGGVQQDELRAAKRALHHQRVMRLVGAVPVGSSPPWARPAEDEIMLVTSRLNQRLLSRDTVERRC